MRSTSIKDREIIDVVRENIVVNVALRVRGGTLTPKLGGAVKLSSSLLGDNFGCGGLPRSPVIAPKAPITEGDLAAY